MSQMEQLGGKLMEARLAKGMSTRTVAALLERHGFRLSHTTVANHEKGRTPVDPALLAAFASVFELDIKFFLNRGPVLQGVRYRNLKSKVKPSERAAYELGAARWLAGYVNLEEALGESLASRRCNFPARTGEDGKSLAKRFRTQLQIADSQPVVSVVEVLEKVGIRTIEVSTDSAIDGLAATLNNEPVVVLNSGVSNDRLRLNAGHELGHILFDDCKEAHSTADEESRVYEFASHFLLPSSQLELAFTGRSFLRLIEFKERFGISLAAMIFRAEKEGIITAKIARWLWVEFAKRGWRKNEPGYVWRDRATRFERLMEDALRDRKLGWQRLSNITGLKVDELRSRLSSTLSSEEGESLESEGLENEQEQPTTIRMFKD